MPIRWNRRVGRRGKVSARLADWTASLAGTFYVASNNSGRIQVQLYDWTGAIQGAVTSAATFRGVITANLENWTAAIVGTRNRPPVWTPATPVTINITSTSPVGTVVVDLAAAGALYATDPDGDALTFTAQNLPSWLTLVGSEIRVAQALTIGASASVTATADDTFGTFGISNPTLVIAQDTSAQPAALGSVTEVAFGSTITRLSASPGSSVWRNFYSNQQAWNADGSLLLLSDNGFAYAVDAAAPYTVRGQIKPTFPADGVGWRWSPTVANEFYYFSNDNTGYVGGHSSKASWPAGWTPYDGSTLLVRGTITSTNPLTITRKVVGAWPQYTGIIKDPSWESIAVDANGKLWVGCMAVDGSSNYWAFAYNITDGEQAATPPTPATVNATTLGVDLVAMTPKGDGLILSGNSGWRLYDLAGNYVRTVSPNLYGHADLIEDSAGDQWVVYVNSATYEIQKAKINGGSQVITPLLSFTAGGVSGGQHVTAGADGDYVIVSFYDAGGGTARPFEREIVKVYLDSTVAAPHVVRVCQHRSLGTDYAPDQPQASLKQDGSAAIFGSNWGTAGGPSDPYIVAMPGPAPQWFLDLPEKRWTPIAGGASYSGAAYQKGLRLSDRYPSPTPGNSLAGVSTNYVKNDALAITSDWTGFVVDQTRGELISLASGGHYGYQGNECYALNLRATTPAWERVLDPTPDRHPQTNAILLNIDITSGTDQSAYYNLASYVQNGDGRCRATHTYNAQAFLNGKVWWTPAAAYNGHCFAFDYNVVRADPAKKAWSAAYNPWSALGRIPIYRTSSDQITGNALAADTTRNRIIGWSRYAYYVWTVDAVTGAIAYASPAMPVGLPQGLECWGVYVPDADIAVFGVVYQDANVRTRRLLCVDCADPLNAASWFLVDPVGGLSWPQVTSDDYVAPTAPGDYNRMAYGAVYHQPSRSILVYDAVLGGTVHKLKIPATPRSGTWTWSAVAHNGAAPSIPLVTNGVFSKFNIVNDMGNGQACLVVCTQEAGPSYVYKLPVGELT
jgi:hypothetical protein